MRTILLVDDNYGDIKIFLDLIKDSCIECNVQVAIDGLDAMDFLLQRGKHVEAIRPDLILLDLNLPKKDGRQVLREIKEHPRLRQIPVLILTSSTAEEDVFASYDSHANGYLTKPMTLDAFSGLLKRIEEFWFYEIKLPKEIKSSQVRKIDDEELGKKRSEERRDPP